MGVYWVNMITKKKTLREFDRLWEPMTIIEQEIKDEIEEWLDKKLTELAKSVPDTINHKAHSSADMEVIELGEIKRWKDKFLNN